MNRIHIIGNLTRSPEERETKNGEKVVDFTVAENHGANRAVTYFECGAFGKTGEACYKYLRKGDKVYVEGTLDLNVYKTMTGAAGAVLKVSVRAVEFLTPKGEKSQDPDEPF